MSGACAACKRGDHDKCIGREEHFWCPCDHAQRTGDACPHGKHPEWCVDCSVPIEGCAPTPTCAMCGGSGVYSDDTCSGEECPGCEGKRPRKRSETPKRSALETYPRVAMADLRRHGELRRVDVVDGLPWAIVRWDDDARDHLVDPGVLFDPQKHLRRPTATYTVPVIPIDPDAQRTVDEMVAKSTGALKTRPMVDARLREAARDVRTAWERGNRLGLPLAMHNLVEALDALPSTGAGRESAGPDVCPACAWPEEHEPELRKLRKVAEAARQHHDHRSGGTMAALLRAFAALDAHCAGSKQTPKDVPASKIDEALHAIATMPFDQAWWLESGPECTRCHVGMSWEGDLPETAEDAICHDCAWKELEHRRKQGVHDERGCINCGVKA